MAPPPVIKIQPAPKKTAGQKGAFDAYILGKHDPVFKNYSQGIYRAALDYGIDPVYFASLLWSEGFSEAHRRGVDVATITSSAGAIGPGQIMPLHIGAAIPWAPGRTLTAADLKDPATNIRYAAYYFGSKLSAAGGNYDQAYRGTAGYNQGGPQIFKDVPRTYVPTTTAKSPTDTAVTSVETAGAKRTLTDPWVVVQNGKLKFVQSVNPPKGAVQTYGVPITRSQFLQDYQSLADDYLAYTGKRPSYAAAAAVIQSGMSQYQVRQQLGNTKAFIGSPVWKQNAPGYEEYYKEIYGPNAKVDTNAIRYAITNNLQGGFKQYLRDQPTYSKSLEFNQKQASLTNVFSRIYGAPTEADHPTITQAIRNGYDENQFAQYLRNQPQWKGSAEAQQLWHGLADRMGFLPGDKQTVISGG